MPNGIEIERKYLLKEAPKSMFTDNLGVKRILQAYLKTEPTGSLRIRQTYPLNDKPPYPATYYLTAKFGSGLARSEIETTISQEAFVSLLVKAETTLIKNRYYSSFGTDRCWEIDVFIGLLDGLVLAEIELQAIADIVIMPDELKPLVIADVTNDPEFINAALARRNNPWTLQQNI